MRFSSIITLTTDFGTEDGYVGAMKGRIKSIFPQSTIIDISHQIPVFSVRSAAFTLHNFFDYFPEGTIHVIVVDPGVGSERTPILIQVQNQFIICPNNGIPSLILEKYHQFKAYELTTQWIQWDLSRTFHGRDLFAPAAAMLLKTGSIESIAVPYTKSIQSFFLPVRLVHQDRLVLKVMHIDHFGNIITNLSKAQWDSLKPTRAPRLRLKKGFIYGIKNTYSDVRKGQLLMLWDSCGYLEIAQNQGNAAKAIGIQLDEEIILEL